MEILLYSVFCFFALYGFAQLASKALDYFGRSDDAKYASTVLTVKDQQDSVEGIVRSAVWSALGRTGGRRVGDVVVVDLGSSDETVSILRSLAEEYSCLHIMDKQEYIRSIQQMI